MWNCVTSTPIKVRKRVDLEVDEARAFVARQGKHRGGRGEMDAFLAELLVEALQSPLGRVVVLAEVAQHDVLNLWTVHLCEEARRLDVAQVTKRSRNPLL